jgi:hypothetical protein
LTLALAAGASLAACGRSGSAASGGGADASSALEKEAQAAVMAEVQKHWAKGSDGWTSALWEGTSFAPLNYLRQYKELSIRGVQSDELDQSDKLNGVEFSGTAYFNEAPAREAGEPGIAFGGNLGANLTRGRGHWTQWVNYKPSDIRVSKVKGQWKVADDTTLTAGKIPTAADFANAGVH